MVARKKKDNDPNYLKSKAARLPVVPFSNEAKELYLKCRELDSITQQNLQDIAHRVCGAFGIKMIPVVFDGVQPRQVKQTTRGRMTAKTQGYYMRSFLGSNILIYRLTAARRQVRSPKAAISTLLHELVHYMDYEITGLAKSIHSSGFYWRIGQLTDMLS